WNLSINQLPARKPVGCSGVGEAAGEGLIAVAAAGLVTAPGAGLSVTGTDVPGTAGCCCPCGTAGCCPCGTFVAGDCMGSAGCKASASSLSSPKFRHFSPGERDFDAIPTVFRKRGQFSIVASSSSPT